MGRLWLVGFSSSQEDSCIRPSALVCAYPFALLFQSSPRPHGEKLKAQFFIVRIVGKVDDSDWIRVQGTLAVVLPSAVARVEPLRSI